MAIILVTLDQAQLALANLLNQNTVPSGEQARRAFFITSGIQRLYRAFDFDMAQQTALVSTDDTGVGDVSDLNLGPLPAVESITDGTHTFTFIMAKDAVQFHQGDYKYWLVLNEDKEWELHTTEPDADLTFIHYDSPEISTSQGVVFTPMVIAKAALIYYRQAQDPEADVSVEEDEFRQEVAELVDAQNRRRPQRFAQSRRDRYNHYVGRQ
jgi:hypothetical protein